MRGVSHNDQVVQALHTGQVSEAYIRLFICAKLLSSSAREA